MKALYAIISMDFLEEQVLHSNILKTLVWCRYTDDIFMMREHGNEELQKFLDAFNYYHFIIKFTTEYSRAQISFLNVTVTKTGCQYLHASLRHISHCKKSIPFSENLRLMIICSENTFFDKRCIDLEACMKKRGYSDKLVREQILKSRKFSRAEISNEQKRVRNENRFVFNITYHPVFSKLKTVISEMHLLLTLDQEHR